MRQHQWIPSDLTQAVVLLLLFTMRCSKRKKAMQQAEPVEQGVALPADFPGSWLMATWSIEELNKGAIHEHLMIL